MGCLLANLVAVAAFQFMRHLPGPAWLHLLIYFFPLVLALVAGVMCLFNLGRDLLNLGNRAAEVDDRPHRRSGLLRDALHIGSPAWSVGFVYAVPVAYALIQITGLPLWLRVLIALTPLVPLVMYLRSISRDTAEIDELALHIRREAYGFVFWAMNGIFVCVYLLEKAGVMPGFRWSSMQLVAMMLALLIVGAAISSRRFR